jgi:hypothetical protein
MLPDSFDICTGVGIVERISGNKFGIKLEFPEGSQE